MMCLFRFRSKILSLLTPLIPIGKRSAHHFHSTSICFASDFIAPCFIRSNSTLPNMMQGHSSRKFHVSSVWHKLCASIKQKNLVSNEAEDTKKTKKKPSKYEIKLPHEEIASALRNCSSVAEQIELFCKLVEISDVELAERFKVCKQLESLLRPYFPECRIFLVGSSVSGFGLKGCDVDLYFETNCGPPLMLLKGQPAVIPTVEEIDNGQTPISKVHELSSKLQLRFARRVLRMKQNSEFKEPMHVVKGRCPILQFFYGPNELICDLSLDNETAIPTTKLLKLCSKLDDRVVPLVKIVIYWAKQVKLVGSIDKFKSYAFTLMVFHFLQIQEPPIIPPLQDILTKAEFFREDLTWDYDLEKDISAFKPSKNPDSVEELLRKFFFYYLYFDYSQAICPLTGETASRRMFFLEESDQPESESQHSEVSTICIQDPIDVSRNVTRVASFRTCAQFMRELYSMCRFFQTKAEWKQSSTENWGLAAMLEHRFGPIKYEQGPLSIKIPLTMDISSSSSPDLCYKASNCVLKVLSHCLLFDCDIIDTKWNGVSEEKLAKNCDIAYEKSVNSTNEVLAVKDKILRNRSQNHCGCSVLTMHCLASNTWQKRYQYKQVPVEDNSVNILERERSLSLNILNSSLTKSGNNPFEFACECLQHEQENGEKCLLLLLTPLEASHFPLKLSVFLTEYIPEIVSRIMK